MYVSGSIVSGKITGIKEYGAFVKVENYDGLVHISEFSDDYVKSIENYVQVGDIVKLEVLSVNEEKTRLKLSYKNVNKENSLIKRVAKTRIGFRTIDECLDSWIEIGYSNLNDKKR